MDAMLTDKAQEWADEIASKATSVEDLNGLLRAVMKSALERMLNTEMDVHLGRKPLDPTTDTPPAKTIEPAAKTNRRNGHSHKTVAGDLGELTLETPRDRDGTFEPQLIPKHQRRITATGAANAWNNVVLVQMRVAGNDGSEYIP